MQCWSEPAIGLILTDLSLRPIAFNSEAVLILSYPDSAEVNAPMTLNIPEEILADIQSQKPNDKSSVVTHFCSGRNQYVCRSYVMEVVNQSLVQPLRVLLLERDFSVNNAVNEVAKQFELTAREREVLRGIALGLTSKEIAGRMSISPNTVKAFLRLIMVKLGVNSRAAILAKILEHNNHVVGNGVPSLTEPAGRFQ